MLLRISDHASVCLCAARSLELDESGSSCGEQRRNGFHEACSQRALTCEERTEDAMD